MGRSIGTVRCFLVLALLPALGACVAAAAGAGAAAGAVGAVAYTDRGAETHVTAGVNEVIQATEAVYTEMGVTDVEREVEESGSVNVDGRLGDKELHVEIQRDDDNQTTHVEVTVKEDELNYDKSDAKDILNRIIERVD